MSKPSDLFKHSKQLVISAVIFLMISLIINNAGAMLTMSYYSDPVHFGLWSKLMMPANGPPGIEFFMASIIISFINGIIFARVYSFIGHLFQGTGIGKGVKYGAFLFLVVGVPFTLTIYLLFAVPVTLLLIWAVSSLIIYLISGAVFAKLIS